MVPIHKTVNIPVRSLVEYVFRRGSIETGFRTASSLAEGTKVHQKVQNTYGDKDEKEVYLQISVSFESITYVVDGRCDGLLYAEEGITIDEIKSTSQDLNMINEETYPVHWAQAIFYAHMYAENHELSSMNIQLTYVQVDTDEQKRFMKTMSRGELKMFVIDVIQKYAPYAQWKLSHLEKRDESVKQLNFPFVQYRDGQRRLAGAVFQTIKEKNNLFAQAPTGIGKTMSTVFPTVKAMGEGLAQKLYYLTAKTITRTAAEEAFNLLKENGLCLNTVTITAKDKICFKDKPNCTKEYCEFADGYYDRINEAILDIVSNERIMSRTVIEQYALKHKVCPFEFSLDVAYAADAVICDYNYVYDPRVSLKRMLEDQKKQTVLLIDESHNLVDRARGMYSSELNKSHFLQLKREYKGLNRSIYEAAHSVNQYFIALRKSAEGKQHEVWKDIPMELVERIEAFCATIEKELAYHSVEENQFLLDVYFSALSFLRISKLYDEHFLTYAVYERNDILLKLFCIDPSHLLKQMGKGFGSRIFFSATLSPLPYYKSMLGTNEEEDFVISIPSPFKKEQLDVLIQPLSTRFRDRDVTKDAVVHTIEKLIYEKPGNHLVFFPSYVYLKDVFERFKERNEAVPTIVQETQMTEEAREMFLAQFKENSREKLLGFAVMGGIFSEGIDLRGDRLNGVIVVGVGLPQFGFERDLMKEYFNSIGKNGFNFAYVYPGMNKVIQAGGRVIRTESDTGTIILIDDRFLQKPYVSLLPDEWRHYKILR